MKKYTINNFIYQLIEDYDNGFDYNVVLEKMTDYFNDFDYIIGDWSYGKLRLKGFCDKDNKLYKSINDIKSKDKYIREMCAYNSKYFVLKKEKDNKKK